MTEGSWIRFSLAEARCTARGIDPIEASWLIDGAIRRGEIRERIIAEKRRQGAIVNGAEVSIEVDHDIRHLNVSDLDKWLETILGGAAAGSKAKAVGGRPPKHDWEGFHVEIIRWLETHNNGLPASQADLVKVMSEWCANTWDEVPVDSEIRKRISRIYVEVAGN